VTEGLLGREGRVRALRPASPPRGYIYSEDHARGRRDMAYGAGAGGTGAENAGDGRAPSPTRSAIVAIPIRVRVRACPQVPYTPR
jgi:hypothetical protein